MFRLISWSWSLSGEVSLLCSWVTACPDLSTESIVTAFLPSSPQLRANTPLCAAKLLLVLRIPHSHLTVGSVCVWLPTRHTRRRCNELTCVCVRVSMSMRGYLTSELDVHPCHPCFQVSKLFQTSNLEVFKVQAFTQNF